MAAEEREKPVSAHIGAPSPRLHRDLQEDCRNGRRKSAPADAAMSFIPFNCGNESLKMPAEIRDTENLIDQEDEHRIRSRCWSGEILSEPVRQAVPLLPPPQIARMVLPRKFNHDLQEEEVLGAAERLLILGRQPWTDQKKLVEFGAPAAAPPPLPSLVLRVECSRGNFKKNPY